MDALFFLTRREHALGVASCDDLPTEPVTDALALADPSAISALAAALGSTARLKPLRDATCRSFPVWELGPYLTGRIAAIDAAGIDTVSEAWRKQAGSGLDADAYELACCLTDLRAAVRAGSEGELLFVLLEERAW